MEFKKGNKYLCLHDMIVNSELMFKNDVVYYCIEDNILVACNNIHFNMNTLPKTTSLSFYFKKYDAREVSSQFTDITKKMNETFIKKNKDYGNSFDKSCDEWGIIAALVRMEDKLNRLKSITKNGNIQVKDESLKDTLLDLANYAIMTIMWHENKKL